MVDPATVRTVRIIKEVVGHSGAGVDFTGAIIVGVP